MSITSPELVAVTREQLINLELVERGPREGADSGEAIVSTGTIYQHPERERPRVGVWQCTEGAWDVVDHPMHEAALLLSGRARLTDASGTVTEFVAGDLMVLPKGWSGRWEILETVRKYFVLNS